MSQMSLKHRIESKSKQIANKMIRTLSYGAIKKIKNNINEALTFIFNDDDERPFETKKSNLLLNTKSRQNSANVLAVSPFPS